MGFKPRPNIFAKLRVRDVDSDSSANTVVENSSNCLDVGSSIGGDDTFEKTPQNFYRTRTDYKYEP